MPSFSV